MFTSPLLLFLLSYKLINFAFGLLARRQMMVVCKPELWSEGEVEAHPNKLGTSRLGMTCQTCISMRL
ncbi:hypothetical protein Hanom_Chr12g01106651 [Helianthus anomalus]